MNTAVAGRPLRPSSEKAYPTAASVASALDTAYGTARDHWAVLAGSTAVVAGSPAHTAAVAPLVPAGNKAVVAGNRVAAVAAVADSKVAAGSAR